MKISARTKGGLSAAAMAVLMLLGSCNFGTEAPEASPTPGPVLPQTVASAAPYRGPEAGEYFNAAEGISLRIDGAGGFVLSAAEGRLEGSYTATEEEIVFLCGGEELRGYPEEGGELRLAGVSGLFSPPRQHDSFSALGVAAVSDREYSEGAEGARVLADYTLQLSLSYPEEMSAPENLIADAVVVWDGEKGYVTGRNVTEEFFGEAEDFMSDYMLRRVLQDFRLLYGAEGTFERMESLAEGVQGRLASAEGLIVGGGERIYVKGIMYTSTYADGTVNYILKCFFAPEGDERSFNTLANSVMNMTAVRRK